MSEKNDARKKAFVDELMTAMKENKAPWQRGWDYLTALNTGHPGGLTSVHANDAVSALFRIAQLAKGSEIGRTMDYDFILNTVRSTIDVVCFFEKTKLKEIYYNPIMKKMALAGRG